MGRHGLARARGVMLAGVAALALAACTGDDNPTLGPGSKAMKPLTPKTLALIQEKGMSKDSPIVVRIFKEESELEVWKETTSGDFALLKTYPICRWSGELGPKVKEGDRQAPEGFYTITPGQMNANSSYYLAFDLGFPNAYDRAYGRTGANLMVHGDCSSSGCYAMTDEQVQELFSLGRESFSGGQRTFQVQAYPFRMTTDNLVRHRNNPNLAFWKVLKEGSDTFEVSKRQLKVDVCNKRYVFDATPVDPAARFSASAPCPEYNQPEDVTQEVAARRAQAEQKIASADPAAPAAPVKTGKDGGMNKVFIAKLQNPDLKAPGSLPPVVKPPGSDYGVATNEPAPADSIALATADMVPQTASVPLPEPRPADAPGAVPAQGTAVPAQVAATSGFSLFNRAAPASEAPAAGAPATTQVAALEPESGGSFLSGVTRLFSRSESAPAEGAAVPAATANAPAASGTSAAPVAAVAPAAPAAESAASSGSTLSTFTNWLTGRSSPPPSEAPQASAPVADVPLPPERPTLPAGPSASAAPRPASATPAVATPALRPSVTTTSGAAAETASSSALPGAPILSTGSLSSSSTTP